MSNEANVGVEVARDVEGKLLWVEQYMLARLHKPGEIFIRDSIEYKVISYEVFYWRKTALIECIVEKTGSKYNQLDEFLKWCRSTQQYSCLTNGEENILEVFVDWLDKK